MASSRKPRLTSKRSGKASDGAQEKDDGGGTYKNRQRKRKLSDMLGPQWSKEELKSFYEAYRKHGKDWRKVAATMRGRTPEMVEALYNLNRAYLSLSDGTASVTGFIAMMIDHYNILEGSNSDRDSSDGSGRPQKQSRLKQNPNSANNYDGSYTGLLQCRSGPSNYGCQSPVKKRRSRVKLAAGNRLRVVGKRTPRFPVSCKVERHSSETVLFSKQEPVSDDDHDDYDVAKAAALTLTAASQRAASPQISRTPSRTTLQMRSSPVRNGDLKGFHVRNGSGGSAIKHTGSAMDEGGLEGSQESREIGNASIRKADEMTLPEPAGAEAAGNLKNKLRKLPITESKQQGLEDEYFDDIKEECSCTEEGIGIEDEKDEAMDTEAVDTRRRKKPLLQRSRKRSRQLFCGDQSFGLNALATLAEVTLNGLMPSPTAESESSVQVKEEKKDNSKQQKGERIGRRVREDGLQEERPRTLLNRENEPLYKTSVNSIEVETKEKHHEHVRSVGFEREHGSPIIESKKRRRKPSAVKLEALGETTSREIQKSEALLVDGTKFKNKKRTANVHALSKQGRLVKPLPMSTSDPEFAISDRGVTEYIVPYSAVGQVSLPTKLRSRRKASLQRAFSSMPGKSLENCESAVVNEQSELHNNVSVFCPHSVTDGVSSMKAKLTHCLSSQLLRQWCTYEWFYSAIDWPWFARNEFVEYLNHAGLGHVPRLTRVEWGVIRSSLGKPRRLSKRFLQEEREKLEQYRESVRKHYNEVRAGIREGLPTDLARPLSVGQRVIACHPRTREVHDGNILTVDRNRCRVQFDRPELGVEFVMDIDCMPLNPLENIPDALRRNNIVLEGSGRMSEGIQVETKSRGWGVHISPKIALNEKLEKAGDGPSFGPPSKYSFNTLLKQAKGDTVDSVIQAKAAANEVVAAAQKAMYNQPCTLAQIQAREADIRALAELTRSLDKKEAILVELRHMNDEVNGHQKNGEAVRSSDNFQKQYATVIHQLRDANEQVASALVYLRQRNTYQENSIPPWHRTIAVSSGVVMDPSAPLALDTCPLIGEIINKSRRRARTLVDVAMQTISSLKEGDDVLRKAGGAFDPIRNVDAVTDSGNLGVKLGSSQFDSSRDTEQETHSFRENSFFSFGPEQTVENISDVKHKGLSMGKELPVPSDLITSCVATLLLIKTCTERQYPPSDVAQMLDGAVTSLQPYSSQNVVIYREIQQSLGVVKNQIFSMIPTHPNIAVSAELPSLSKK
ncbi:protein ALWAYS EARLY 2 isoform X2 [Cryptomeria japonica]|uniref:protein ALWAYS EARLY 2 isoform X2 n=1 Tax=Cryptomeria japonica TaxID=3369 RepID=UPI0025ABE6F9|nr:protein ALWAYS EARLY 2 isoform X2 [Cryptomeria japonica]